MTTRGRRIWLGLGDIGRAIGARYDELRLWHADQHTWRVLLTDDRGYTSIVGDPAKTETDVLPQLDRIHADWMARHDRV